MHKRKVVQLISVSVFALGMFFLFVLFVLFPLWPFSVIPHPEPELSVMSAEEFQAALDKFANDSDYIEAHVNFTINTIAYYRVYGDMADGNVEKAIRIFNHPEYPKNVYNIIFVAYEVLENGRKHDPEFAEMFDEEIADIRIGRYDDGIVVSVNPAYSSQENFDRYEDKFREQLEHYHDYIIPLTFEEKNMFDIRVPSGAEFFSNPEIMMSLFVLCTVIFIVYFVRGNMI